MTGAGFLPWVRYVTATAKRIGHPLSAREARPLAAKVVLALAAENEPPPLHSDPTGEEAVRRVLMQQLAA